ncbi:YceD family protein [Acinetobacter rudis]|uniref:Large ribosomal RNA subunit accumulation protein YceD n=1 Tax=Acinetobacter rudis TaxID=632955 RepID=A0AAW8J8D6_9GAMM|nr:YceD family protein [Acinetobacter rudis]MDQ8935441.1 YceD family protein [Acinetobacter rudis]MDQ8953515.1 YceD family protein [Acinetobacter rudis]MDQ9017792.1 YceD family protein [Acinetobacter rudis]
MSANTFPAQIEPFKWAEQGYSWSGNLPLSRFVRIAREAVGPIDDQLINIDCKLSMDAFHRIVWLSGRCETHVPMECQRCLEPVDIALVSDFHLALIDDESLIERLDEDADFIVLGESEATTKGDYSTPATVDLLSLLEDELLLLLPLSPKHTACEHKHQPAEEEVVEEKRDNPFDVLAGLKGKLS